MIDYFTIDGLDLHDIVAGIRMLDKVEGLIGFPTPRDTTIKRSEGDGVIEPRDQYLDAKVPVLEGCIFGTVDTVPSAWTNWTATQKVLLAALRTPKLCKWRSTGTGVDLQAYMRVAGPCTPVLDTNEHGAHYRYQLILRAADPLAYSQSTQSVVASAPAVAVSGMPLPVIFPIPFGLIGTGGSVVATAGGTAPAWPLITITGPINGPVIRNDTQNKSVFFEGLNLGVGEQLVIDTNPASRTAVVLGVSKMGAIRYADSIFWGLTPGVAETLSFYGLGLGYNGSTQMTVAWRDTYTG